MLIASAADWPQYGGPDGRWVADAGDHIYLKSWSKARLVWTSETAEIGPGRGQAPRYGYRNAAGKGGIDHWGGAASPVIAGGTIYQVTDNDYHDRWPSLGGDDGIVWHAQSTAGTSGDTTEIWAAGSSATTSRPSASR